MNAIYQLTIYNHYSVAAVVELNATDLTVAESDGNVSVCVEVTQGNILVNSEIFLNSISVSTTGGLNNIILHHSYFPIILLGEEDLA